MAVNANKQVRFAPEHMEPEHIEFWLNAKDFTREGAPKPIRPGDETNEAMRTMQDALLGPSLVEFLASRGLRAVTVLVIETLPDKNGVKVRVQQEHYDFDHSKVAGGGKNYWLLFGNFDDQDTTHVFVRGRKRTIRPGFFLKVRGDTPHAGPGMKKDGSVPLPRLYILACEIAVNEAHNQIVKTLGERLLNTGKNGDWAEGQPATIMQRDEPTPTAVVCLTHTACVCACVCACVSARAYV